MTISSDVIKSGPYDGNGVTTSFDYNYKIFADADLRVIHTSALGVETDLTLGVDYTVSGAGDESGGSITYPVSGSPLPSGEKLTILSNITIEQQTDLSNQGGFFPEVHETVFDKLCRMIQQHAEKINRAVVVDPSSADTPSGLIDAIYAAVAAAAASASAAAASAAAAAASYLDFDNRYLGSHATNPTTLNDSTPLDASHDGIEFWDSTLKVRKVWNGGTLTWGLTSTSVATNAVDVNVSDAGDLYEGANVESILQEINPAHHFRVRAKSTPDLTVNVAAGVLQRNKFGAVSGDFSTGVVTQIAAQTVTGFTIPGSGNERYFHVAIDRETGVAVRNNGIEASIGSGTLPSINDSEIVLAEIHLINPDTTVQQSNITDLRPSFNHWRTDGKVYLGTVTLGVTPPTEFPVFTTDYDCYEYHFQNCKRGAGPIPQLEMHQDGGAWLTGASDYDFCQNHSTTPTTTTSLYLAGNTYNTAGDAGMNGTLRIFNPLATDKTQIIANMAYENNSNNIVQMETVGRCNQAVAIDQMRLNWSGAGTPTGRVHIYGLRST